MSPGSTRPTPLPTTAIRDHHGTEGRDAVWTHPDLIPTAADLDDPLGFAAGETKTEAADEEFDAALAELLDSEAPDSGAPDPGAPDSGAPDSGAPDSDGGGPGPRG